MGEGSNEVNPYDDGANKGEYDRVRFTGFDTADNQAPDQPQQVRLVVRPVESAPRVEDNSEQTTEVIRADIDQTRSEMSLTIDAIQQKLNPQLLMEQAKATVMETATELIDHAKDTAAEAVDHAKEAAVETASELMDHAKEAAVEAVDHTKQAVHDATVGKVEHMVSNITDTAQETGSGIVGMIKNNPLPAALVGLGLGWMYMKNQNNKPAASKAPRYVPQRVSATPSYPTSPSYDYGYSSQMRGTNPYINSNPYAPASSYDNGQTGSTDGLVSRVMETIQQNPIPAALAGLGVGYLVMQGQGSKSQSNNYPSYGNQYNGQAGIGQKVGDVASQAGDTVGNIAQKAGDTVGSVTQKAGDLVGQAGGKVGDIAGGVAGGVGDTVGAVAGGVGNTVGAVAGGVGAVVGGVGDIAGGVVGGVGNTVGSVVEGVQYQTQQAETTFGRLLEEKPLAVGAVALALGLTVGMMLPNTSQENQLMGAAHDTLMEKVQETTQQTFEKVQHVTEEVGNTTKNAVADISNTASQQAHEQGLIK